ncbi:unnamed protein product [Soboliphyme baturini]|uniref:Uncharacterized protein n=1 Tax=Soboliphyme baturini TaxID=241478 RepID=A0A183II05_9BILA|nr:unnamed protein product [Soboliphyme baturini]
MAFDSVRASERTSGPSESSPATTSSKRMPYCLKKKAGVTHFAARVIRSMYLGRYASRSVPSSSLRLWPPGLASWPPGLLRATVHSRIRTCSVYDPVADPQVERETDTDQVKTILDLRCTFSASLIVTERVQGRNRKYAKSLDGNDRRHEFFLDNRFFRLLDSEFQVDDLISVFCFEVASKQKPPEPMLRNEPTVRCRGGSDAVHQREDFASQKRR